MNCMNKYNNHTNIFLQKMLDSVPSEHLPDICASIVKSSVSEKIQVLDAIDLSERFKKTLPLLIRQIEVRLFLRYVNIHQYL